MKPRNRWKENKAVNDEKMVAVSYFLFIAIIAALGICAAIIFIVALSGGYK